MSSQPQVIHHLVPASELRAGCKPDCYRPERFSEDGFVHCSASAVTTLAVADDYFADLGEPLFVLTIETSRLRAEVRFEAAAPLAEAGRLHLETAPNFPHVYGAIEREAICGVGRLERHDNRYTWPRSFESIEATLASL